MPGLTLDASVALSALLLDEDSETAKVAQERVADEGTVTRSLGKHECY